MLSKIGVIEIPANVTIENKEEEVHNNNLVIN